MDWVEGWCLPGYERLHFVTLVLGGMASGATTISALHAFWRWLAGGRHKKAADTLRDEGEHRRRDASLYRALSPRATQRRWLPCTCGPLNGGS
jgi:hypothetical protein